jgi:hypothetical protein
MLKLTRTTTAASLLALAAMLALPGGAKAACTPAVTSDGNSNTCIGSGALSSNTYGVFNTALGKDALKANTGGDSNTASGVQALFSNTTGVRNTASGVQALFSNTTGRFNTASGVSALLSNTTGSNNTASGDSSLRFNTTGDSNTASGTFALSSNTTGGNNTASGFAALFSNTTGEYNTASGTRAGGKQTGSYNTSLGAEAAFRGDLLDDTLLLTGNNNIAVGYQAGSQWGANNTAISNNIAIGHVGGATDANTIRIGTSQTRTFIAGIRGIRVTKTQAVLVDANGQIGTSRSSIRYKEDVHTMGDASNPLMNLRPVTFRYKEAESDGSKPIQYGLIAEEVEKVMPDLVIYNAQGTPESVAYETLPSLLLNEYQKQGRKLADAETYLAANQSELVETKAKLAAAEDRLAASDARLESIESELAALKLAVSRLAAAPAAIKLAGSQP